jgi:hypothetical protein
MGNTIKLSEIDCIFISYDEPNAEKNWIDLVEKCWWAERVHGVKGSDACHKAAAEKSQTEWFVSVDGDNIVDAKFFDLEIDMDKYPNANALNWPGLNSVNGLRYGNGGLKVWNKEFVLNMKTHEASADDKGQVDFCWEDGYQSMVDVYSVSHINETPFQSWRAGFREGVKMCLVNGELAKDKSLNSIFWQNAHRLKIWMSVGTDVQDGIWAMVGARHGCWKTTCSDWNHIEVRDFDCLEKIWEEVKDVDPYVSCLEYAKRLETDLGLSVPYLDAPTSTFVKDIFEQTHKQITAEIKWALRNV